MGPLIGTYGPHCSMQIFYFGPLLRFLHAPYFSHLKASLFITHSTLNLYHIKVSIFHASSTYWNSSKFQYWFDLSIFFIFFLVNSLSISFVPSIQFEAPLAFYNSWSIWADMSHLPSNSCGTLLRVICPG